MSAGFPTMTDFLQTSVRSLFPSQLSRPVSSGSAWLWSGFSAPAQFESTFISLIVEFIDEIRRRCSTCCHGICCYRTVIAPPLQAYIRTSQVTRLHLASSVTADRPGPKRYAFFVQVCDIQFAFSYSFFLAVTAAFAKFLHCILQLCY